MYTLPPISEIQKLLESEKRVLLDHLFEHCETLQDFLIPKVFNQTYKSYTEFIEQCRLELLWFLSQEHQKAEHEIDPRVSKIIAAHPRLGAQKKQVALSEHSATEQASLQRSSEEEKQKLLQLNEEYEKQFPGLRYVVFVNGRPRDVIMENMRQRIDRNDIKEERKEAFNAMCDIALDRAGKLTAKL